MQVRSSLGNGRLQPRALGGRQEIGDCLFNIASFGVVMCQQFRLRLDDFGKALLQCGGDSTMQLLTACARQHAVSGIAHQHVLEQVRGKWWRPATEYQFRGTKLVKGRMQHRLVGGDGT